MNSQSGNVLFLILIAVALFAALSYAVTSSSRNGEGSASKETAKANASALLSHLSALRFSINRLRVTNGCREDQLNFANSIYKNGHGTLKMTANTNAPTSGACDVYSPSAGNITPFVVAQTSKGPPLANLAENLPGHANIGITQLRGIGTDGSAGTATANDLFIYFESINKQTCTTLNEMLGVDNPGGDPPSLALRFDSYGNGSFVSNRIVQSTATNNFPGFCMNQDGLGFYGLVYALLER